MNAHERHDLILALQNAQQDLRRIEKAVKDYGEDDEHARRLLDDFEGTARDLIFWKHAL